MIAVLQRVYHATVFADGEPSGEIGGGLYILLGVENGDTEEDVGLLVGKISRLRIFSDENGKMNLSVRDVNGEVMVVSNFTLNANYVHGNRPDFLKSAPPAEAERLYGIFVDEMRATVGKTATGRFGADMRTEMATDGPVTIVMHSSALKKGGK